MTGIPDRVFYLFFLLQIVQTFAVAATQPQFQTKRAVGLVSELPGSARIRRAGLQTPIPLYLGDLLFPGDTVIAQQGTVAISFCPANAIYSISSGEISVTEKRAFTADQKDAVPASHLPFPCLLPAVSSDGYRDVRAGANRSQNALALESPGDSPVAPSPTPQQTAELDVLNAILSRNPKDIAGLLARAIVLESANDLSGSSRDYTALSKIIPKAAWVEDELNASVALRARRASGEGKIIAVIVGISLYQNLDNNLQFADRDATSFYDYLVSPRGRARAADVTLLLNEQAKYDSIRLAINEAFARARPQDKVVLFIAAHGIVLHDQPDPSNNGAYIAAYNADKSVPTSTMFRMDDLKLITSDRLRPDWLQVYADMCHAQNIAYDKQRLFEPVFMSGNDRTGDMKVVGFLASDLLESYECSNLDQGHGAFTYFLLRGLNSDEALNDNKEITIQSLEDYIEKNVRDVTHLMKPRQNPALLVPSDVSSERVVDNLKLTGISIGPSSGSNACSSTRGLTFPKLTPPKQSGLHDDQSARLADELNAGQEVLIRYLHGETIPPDREDFVRGEAAFSEASHLQGGADPFTESRLLFCIGRKLIFDKKYQDAITALEESIRKDPLGAYSYNALGIAYLETPDYPKAIKAFKDAITLAPYWAYAHHNLALALVQAGQYRPAIAAYQQAIKLGPSDAYIPFNFGLLYQRLNRPVEARILWFHLVKTDPNMSRAWNAIGLSYALEGNRSKAENYYNRALSTAAAKTDRLAVKHDLALLLESENRGDEALSLWRQNLAEEPQDLPSLVGMSEALYNRGDTTAATTIFVELLNQKPEFAGARLQFAKLLAKSGTEADTNSSAAQLRLILAKTPNNAEACGLLADILAASPRRSPEDIRAATELYSRAIDNSASRQQRRRLEVKRRRLSGV